MKPKFPVTTLPEYDEMIMKQMKVSGGDAERLGRGGVDRLPHVDAEIVRGPWPAR